MDKKTQQELLNTVKNNYQEIGQEFSRSRDKALWPELLKLADAVNSGDKVLDAGCGNGRLLAAFSGKEINYLGVDNSQELIDLARKNCELRVASCEFSKVDILELGQMPQTNFNYVFAVAVLHHLPSQELRTAALKQLKNKIKPDGRIIITVWNLWSQPKFRKLIGKFALLKMFKKHRMDFGDILFDWQDNRQISLSRRYYHACTKRELKKLAKTAGLKVEKLYKDKYNYYMILKRQTP